MQILFCTPHNQPTDRQNLLRLRDDVDDYINCTSGCNFSKEMFALRYTVGKLWAESAASASIHFIIVSFMQIYTRLGEGKSVYRSGKWMHPFTEVVMVNHP